MKTNIVSRINSTFNNKRIRTFLVNFRYPISFVFLFLILFNIKAVFLLPAFLVSLFGEMIQVWSFASLDKNTSLAIRGPYCLTRNPMYIGRFFLLLGGVLLFGEIWIVIVFVIIYYFYATNRVKREETKLIEIFQEKYQSYCSRVNRFVPSFKDVDFKSLAYFKWNLLLKNNGHKNLLGFFLAYLLFYCFVLFKIGAHLRMFI